MKTKKLCFWFCALSCAIFLAACSNASGGGGTSASADIFASAKTALRAMDVSVDLSSSGSRSALSRSAEQPTMGEITSVGGTLPADKFFGINETDKIGQGIAINCWSDYSADWLSGKVSQSQCILEMCKKEVPEQITNLEYNKDYDQEVTGNYKIGNLMTIVVKKLRVNHVEGSDEMTVFCVADVYAANDTARSDNKGPYNAILKCKANAVENLNLLDTELYMFNGNSQKFCAKFVRKSVNEKTKTCWETTQNDTNRWEAVTITPSGITGYKHANSRKHYISIKGGYSAMWFCYDQNVSQYPYSSYVMDKDGCTIKVGFFDEDGNLGSTGAFNGYLYYLNFVSGTTGYKVKRVDSNPNYSYKLLNANDVDVATIYRHSCYRSYGQPEPYTYVISESEMKNAGLSCSVASQIEGMSESVKNHELKAVDYISINSFDTTLPTALNTWLSN